jgi:predicted RNase H-like HicB family nuclease
MTYPVFVQAFPDQGYMATVLGWPDCQAEGPTKEKALANVRAVLSHRLAQGEIFSVEVEPAPIAAPDAPIPDPEDPRLWEELEALSAEIRAEALGGGRTLAEVLAELPAARQQFCEEQYGA